MIPRLLSGARGAGIVLVVSVAGIGWLYLLRHDGALDIGPRLPEALPLQRLAGGAAQPLGRMVAAWFPAGIVGGAALVLVWPARRAARAGLMFGVCAVLLLVLGAVSDAVTASESIGAHVGAQAGRVAIWLAAALAAAGAALPGPARGRR
jgi:hypothetical protein